MSRHFLMLSMLLIGMANAHATHASCGQQQKPVARLHWSEHSAVASMDRKWELRVDPGPSLRGDDDMSPVTVVRCKDKKEAKLFLLRRSATALWSPSNDAILIIDEPGTGHSELMLFEPARVISHQGSGPKKIDKAVREVVLSRLGANGTVAFYLPKVVDWHQDRVVIRVSGASLHGETGPTHAFCYGVVVDTRLLRVESVLSETLLRKRFPKVDCPAFP